MLKTSKSYTRPNLGQVIPVYQISCRIFAIFFCTVHNLICILYMFYIEDSFTWALLYYSWSVPNIQIVKTFDQTITPDHCTKQVFLLLILVQE